MSKRKEGILAATRERPIQVFANIQEGRFD
jgi:hypothetical protein